MNNKYNATPSNIQYHLFEPRQSLKSETLMTMKLNKKSYKSIAEFKESFLFGFYKEERS